MREHAAGGLEDLPGTAAVLFEDYRLDVIVALEAHQHVGIGAGPGEDGLLVITHREEAAVWLDQLLQQIVLHRVHVLELVDQDMIPAVRDAIGERLGLDDQLVEIHHVAVRQPALVLVQQPLVAGCETVTLKAMPAEQRQQLAAPIGRHP